MELSLPLGWDEKRLIQACTRQERWAQQWLYEEYSGTLLQICRRYATTDDEALDILHEGFIKIFTHIGAYKPGTSLLSWMKRIMINTSIDYYRKAVRRRTQDVEEAFHLSADDADAISQCSEAEIMEAVQQLPTTYRMVFNLYVLEGLAHAEIAELLHITESTSRANLAKARAKLKDLLTTTKYGYERRD